jgi:[acyl-carrier-protein] S-malonyltransferase
MIANGVTLFVEVGPGTVLQGLIKKVKRDIPTESAQAKLA